ncbi:MAG: ribose 5-phosphate isomerase B [Acidimicrobiia bacterium]
MPDTVIFMRVAIASDHAGLALKSIVVDAVVAAGHSALDLGTHTTEPVDYPDVAAAAGRAVLEGRADRGIVICGSGAGACVAANKLQGIRAAVAHETYTAHQMVQHDDVNVLCLGARVVGTHVAVEVVEAFLNATFSHEERHWRRLAKVKELDAR